MVTIEARMTRVGTTNKPSLPIDEVHHVFDFDQYGSTMPDAKAWSQTTDDLAINLNDDILIREADSVFCGPRLHFMLRSTGFLQAQSEAMVIAPETLGFAGFVDSETVFNALSDKAQIIDVRSQARFSGSEADPRPYVKAGHIPGSINIPYKHFINPENPTKLCDKAALLPEFASMNVDLSQPLIFSCGSGITACIGALAAIACGATHCQVYDGSWSEWGANPNLPAVTV